MKLSIIVPVYNMAAGKKLQYCIDSLLNQTIDDYEIIAVDDCSTDESLSILKQYESQYPDMLTALHAKENLRQGGAKNIGIRHAKGEWIGFIDSDDWIHPTMYEKLLKKAADTGADVVGCDYHFVDKHTMEIGKRGYNHDNAQTGILDVEKYKKLVLKSGSMVIKIYKRQMITQNELYFPEYTFYEDNTMSPLYFLYSKHFELVDEPLYYYYQHEISTVHHVSEEKCKDRMQTSILLIEECRRRGFYDEYFTELEYRFTQLYLINTLFSYMAGAKTTKVSFIKELRTGILEYFPKFMDNTYYTKQTPQEEKKLIAMFIKSPIYFYSYYKALWFYRHLKGIRKS